VTPKERNVGRTKTLDRITVEAGKMNGQPCIRGMRITVRRVLEALANYPSREDFRKQYPELEDEDIRQALEYAAAALEDRTVELTHVP
jgi:uncharacterized protein (DUF433 family)